MPNFSSFTLVWQIVFTIDELRLWIRIINYNHHESQLWISNKLLMGRIDRKHTVNRRLPIIVFLTNSFELLS